ncbi:MAG TPA: energy-coupling factor ABC transporter ATP-binding protein [Bacillota bacterium]|nr:energy-coupling factor ABC transporter ATP-binding protein [Bacillota bacterium]
MDITFKNVSYTYQPKSPFEHQALNDISFNIPSGKFVAIIGHTGSGKSTLLQHLNGLLMPTEGSVEIGAYTLAKEDKPKDMKELRSKVGVVFQYPEHQLFEETIAKDIAFGPENFNVSEEEIDARTKDVITKVGLDESFLERSPFDLSGGQMRRVAIAGVLAIKPEVLVLDEPTAGLDPRGQKEIMDMFAELHEEEQLTTVLVTHSMEDALTYADYIIILNEGSLYMEGTSREVFSNAEALRKVNLDVPEIVQFIHAFEQKFSTSIPFENQSLQELAQIIKQRMEGEEV